MPQEAYSCLERVVRDHCSIALRANAPFQMGLLDAQLGNFQAASQAFLMTYSSLCLLAYQRRYGVSPNGPN